MASEISVEIRGLTKRFGEIAAVDSVSLDIRRGEFFSLLGPSGCGKTTLLRMIGGFELPTAGTHPHRRRGHDARRRRTGARSTWSSSTTPSSRT